MSTLTFGFIGLGLIGGSIARAIRQNLPQSQIIAYDINADTLREAAQCGVANVITTRIDASFSDCDYLFLCAPVQKNDENLSAVKEILSPKTLLTDVGSVKSEIHTEIKKAGLEGQFIGGHPMAGSALSIPRPFFWRMPITFSRPRIPFRKTKSRIIKILYSSWVPSL